MSTDAMSMSARVVLGLIVVIALGSSSQSFAAPNTLSRSKIQFTRCDNSTEPIGKIEISACKDQEEFCIFKYGSSVTAEFEFTPAQDHAHSDLGFDFVTSALEVNACKAEGAKCPFEAGVKQHIKAVVPILLDTQKGNKAKLFMTNERFSKDYWYCIEMPAKLI